MCHLSYKCYSRQARSLPPHCSAGVVKLLVGLLRAAHQAGPRLQTTECSPACRTEQAKPRFTSCEKTGGCKHPHHPPFPEARRASILNSRMQRSLFCCKASHACDFPFCCACAVPKGVRQRTRPTEPPLSTPFHTGVFLRHHSLLQRHVLHVSVLVLHLRQEAGRLLSVSYSLFFLFSFPQ